jgi:hypothetical protein
VKLHCNVVVPVQMPPLDVVSDWTLAKGGIGMLTTTLRGIAVVPLTTILGNPRFMPDCPEIAFESALKLTSVGTPTA